ncbi:PAS domain-containing protein, partial [bacterium]|nr:PAS domain-containing protein [bacterium]
MNESAGKRVPMGRLLLADSEKSVLETAKRILEGDGWSVRAVSTGAEVLKAAEEERYDLVLVDCGIPGNEHLEFVRLLGQRWPDCPIIVLTGDPYLPSAVESLHLAVFDYLPKPLDIAFLRKRVRDAVEQEHFGEVLTGSEARLKALLSAMPDLIFRMSADGVFLEFHGREEDLYVPLHMFLGHSAIEVFPQKVSQRFLDATARVIETGETQNLDYSLFIQGALRHYESRVVPLPDKEALHVARDVTDRRQAERDLKRSEERLRSIIDTTPAAYCCLDRQGKYQSVNAAWLRLHKYRDAEEIRGVSFLDTCAESDRESAGGLLEALLHGKPIRSAEIERLNSDGSTGGFTISATPVYQGEVVIGAEAFLIDTSEQREARAALRESEEKYRIFVDQAAEGVFRIEFREPLPTHLTLDQQIDHVRRNAWIAEVNRTSAHLMGRRSAEDICHQALRNIVRLDEEELTGALREFLCRHYRLHGREITVRVADGSSRSFLYSLIGTVRDARLVHVWGTILDVTE